MNRSETPELSDADKEELNVQGTWYLVFSIQVALTGLLMLVLFTVLKRPPVASILIPMALLVVPLAKIGQHVARQVRGGIGARAAQTETRGRNADLSRWLDDHAYLSVAVFMGVSTVAATAFVLLTNFRR